MTVDIVPATQAHADVIAANPRQADEVEVRASCGLSVGWALRYGLRKSSKVWTAIIDGIPVCMFGVTLTSAITGTGTVWCLASSEMSKPAVRRQFIEHSPHVLQAVQERFPGTLFNAVDVRNLSAIRWLKWMGFKLLPPEPMGRNGELFQPFYIRGSHGDAAAQ